MAYANVEWTGGDLVASTKLSQMVENTDIVRGGLIENPYKFRAYCSENQSIATASTWQDVEFDRETYDTNSDFNTTTYSYTVPVTGYYQVNYQIGLGDVNLTALFWTRLLIDDVAGDGSGHPQQTIKQMTSATLRSNDVVFSDLLYLTAGEVLKVQVYCEKTTASTFASRNAFSAHLVSI